MMKIDELDRDQLLELIKSYDKYVINKRNDEENTIDNCIVCINEFFDNEFTKIEKETAEYIVNFDIFASRVIKAVSIKDAREKFMELTKSQIMVDIEYEINNNGLEIGTIEKV